MLLSPVRESFLQCKTSFSQIPQQIPCDAAIKILQSSQSPLNRFSVSITDEGKKPYISYTSTGPITGDRAQEYLSTFMVAEQIFSTLIAQEKFFIKIK